MLFKLWGKKQKLIVVFSFRYDEQLVPDLLKNIEPFADDYIAWDDRKNDLIWRHDGEANNRLTEEARAKKADWVLHIDADERFEKNAGRVIREIIKSRKKVVYGFPFRELWTPHSYRVDGVWGKKAKYVLFPLLTGQKFMNTRVHSQVSPQNDDYERVLTNVNLYHFKMIDPKNRLDRMRLYKQLDPVNQFQSIGYDYLNDESGLVLEEIAKGREYFPSYRAEYQIHQIQENK
jgi:hypothetical protein